MFCFFVCLFVFFPELWLLIVHTYMVQISLQNFGGKVVFLGSSPLGANRSKSTLATFKCQKQDLDKIEESFLFNFSNRNVMYYNNDITQGILLNVVLLTTLVFLSIGGHVVCSHTST